MADVGFGFAIFTFKQIKINPAFTDTSTSEKLSKCKLFLGFSKISTGFECMLCKITFLLTCFHDRQQINKCEPVFIIFLI